MFKCGNCFGDGGMSGGSGLGVAGGGNRQGLNMKLALLEATSEQDLKKGRVRQPEDTFREAHSRQRACLYKGSEMSVHLACSRHGTEAGAE